MSVAFVEYLSIVAREKQCAEENIVIWAFEMEKKGCSYQ
jgi:hypothetical protein